MDNFRSKLELVCHQACGSLLTEREGLLTLRGAGRDFCSATVFYKEEAGYSINITQPNTDNIHTKVFLSEKTALTVCTLILRGGNFESVRSLMDTLEDESIE